MKKLLFILSILFLVSCTTTIEQGKIDNPKKETTVEIQQNIIDSCVVIATDDKNTTLYIIEDGLAVKKFKAVPGDKSIVSDGFLTFVVVMFIFLFLLIIRELID